MFMPSRIWAHLVSNQGPTGYEPVALPTELWARLSNTLTDGESFVNSAKPSINALRHVNIGYSELPKDGTLFSAAKGCGYHGGLGAV